MKYAAIIMMILTLANVSFADITDLISFRSSEFEITTELAPDSNYYHKVECSLANQTLADSPGRPWLPAVNYVYSLPPGMKISDVTINTIENVLLEELVEQVYPGQYPFATCIDCDWPDFVPPDTSLILDEPPLVSVISPASYACGMPVGVIQVRPISYIRESNALVLNENISLTINITANEEQPLEVVSRSIYSQQVAESYLHGIVRNIADIENNMPEIQTFAYDDPNDPENIPPDYIVITSQALYDDVSRFAEYKRQSGHQVETAAIEDIYSIYTGADNQSRIREYLRQKYSEGTLYAVFIGDEDIVPMRYAYYYNWNNGGLPDIADMVPCDMYYACLDGTWDGDGDGVYGEPDDHPDLAADIFVGRIPVNDTGQLEIWLDKLMTYENNPGNGDPSYLMNVVFSAADQLADGSRDEYIAESFVYNPYFDVDYLTFRESPSGYHPNPSSPYGQQLVDYFNTNGVGYYFSLNHGSPAWFALASAGINCANMPSEDCWRSGFTTDPIRAEYPPDWGYIDDIDYESNGRVYVHSSISCYLGMMDCPEVLPWNSDTLCYAESDLLMPGGSVAGTYNTRQGWVFSSSALEQMRVEILMSGVERNLFAPVHYAIKPYFPNKRDVVYCNTYFGDPGFAIYTESPRTFEVIAPSELQIGGYDIFVQVLDSQSRYGEGDVLVTLTKGDELYQRSLTNASGYAYFAINPETPGEMSVTCVKQNYLRHSQVLAIEPICDMASPGDINGDGQVIGSDVLYGVNYFRGIGNPPVLKCWCPDYELYHAADVNGDCQFIGSDITCLVNYFRGITTLAVCPGCSESSLAVEDNENTSVSFKR